MHFTLRGNILSLVKNINDVNNHVDTNVIHTNTVCFTNILLNFALTRALLLLNNDTLARSYVWHMFGYNMINIYYFVNLVLSGH